jgi:antibiotic biosynthesis monooxygenase (ABM) superfamily enzyme
MEKVIAWKLALIVLLMLFILLMTLGYMLNCHLLAIAALAVLTLLSGILTYYILSRET